MATDLTAALAAATRVVVIGDTHSAVDAVRLAASRAADLGIHVLLHVGDLGVGPWPGEARDTVSWATDRDLERLGSWLPLTPGNHENHSRLATARRDDAGRIVLGRHGRLLGRGGLCRSRRRGRACRRAGRRPLVVA